MWAPPHWYSPHCLHFAFVLRISPDEPFATLTKLRKLLRGRKTPVTVLVSGGAGYIGSHAARILRKHGFEALIYDNLSTGCASLAKGFELVTGDVANVK